MVETFNRRAMWPVACIELIIMMDVILVEERMEYDGNIKKKNVNFSKILNEFSKLHTYCVCKQRNLVIEIVVDFIFCWQTNEVFISHAVLEPRTVKR